MDSSATIREFTLALDEEIGEIKKGRGGSIVKVFNGRFLREIGGLSVYKFNLDNFLAVLDEVPAEIEVNGSKYQAHILLTQNQEAEIGIERFCGELISEAKLQINQWYLLELLKERYLEFLDGSKKIDFALSEVIFTGKQSKAPLSGKPQYDISSEVPNDSQKKSIQSSFSSQLSLIWGPPGTGKTKTIAQAAEAHLNAGRSVLLVSHANNAVDEALIKIAKQMKPTSLYQEGKIVRLGKPQEEQLKRIEADYELVLFDNIVVKTGQSLTTEKLDLEKQKTVINDELDHFVVLNQAISKYKAVSSEKSSLLEAVEKVNRELSATKNVVMQSKTELEKTEVSLRKAKSAGTLKRWLTGIDPKKLQLAIDQMKMAYDSKKRLEDELIHRLYERKKAIKTKEQQITQAKNEADSILQQLGLTEKEIATRTKEYKQQKDVILSRIEEIYKQLEEIQKNILSEARLVATTLTKTYISKQFPDIPFDVLILDEASMSPLPLIYWAAGRCRQMATIVGDFLQLPPICKAEKKEMAWKWLGRNIYDVLGINEVDKAKRDSRVTMLDTQYRMNPAISAIPNSLFYGNNLNNYPLTMECQIDDGVSQSPLVLIETSASNPWCSRLSTGGRFNLYSAMVSVTLAKRVSQNIPRGRIGIITPYAAQSRLINKILRDWELLDEVRTSTVHRFQGGEEEVIIIDTCEGPVTKVAPMLDDKVDSTARLLLNVALTRAKSKLYIVGHTEHLLHHLHTNSSLARIIKHFNKNADIIASESLVDSYFATDFEKWAEALLPTSEPNKEPISGDQFTEKNFWVQFLQDIKTVNKRLFILSPFLTVRRTSFLIDYLRAMRERGVDIRVFTKPENEHTGEMVNQAHTVIEQLRSVDIKVIERSRLMHQKIAILDNRILWGGSLNILSHRDTEEQMWRFEGPTSIEDTIRNLELDKDISISNKVIKSKPASSERLSQNISEKSSIKGSGFCIRCHTKIKLNPMSPYCTNCEHLWMEFNNEKYQERYCHICGKPHASLHLKPSCYECYKEKKDILDFPTPPGIHGKVYNKKANKKLTN